MKKLLIISLLFMYSFALADAVLLVKQGWQLIGSSIPLSDMSKFKKGQVEQVLHFDASTQTWLGYSPDETIQNKMKDKGLDTLTSLENWHGFWVKSSKDWALLLDDTKLSSVPTNIINNDVIKLKKGWNLISLPIDIVVSAKIFGDLTVWKYNAKKDWELSTNKNNSNDNDEKDFAPISHIKNSDGLWVKADNDQNISLSQESSKLHSFASSEDMKDYITQMATLYQRPYCGIEPFFLPRPQNMIMQDDVVFSPIALNESSDMATKASNTSSTNLQENEVDEADILKHDGTSIFYKISKDNTQSIAVTSFKALSENNHTSLNKITFDDNKNISNMYLLNKRLVVIGSIYENAKEEYFKEEDFKDSYIQSTSKIFIDIFDVSNINDIKKQADYKIDGDAVTSRMVGESLYLVSQFSPQIEIHYPKIKTSISQECSDYFEGKTSQSKAIDYADCYGILQDYTDNSYYFYDYDNPEITINQLMPNIEGSMLEKQALLTPERFYAPFKKQQKSSISTLSHFDIDKASYTQSTSIIGNSSIQYASAKAFYLLSNEYPYYYDFDNYKERSNIYKFNLDTNLSYDAIGSVYGHAINQFALSEHEDILRIATTEGFSWGSDGTNNSLYTLQSKDGLLNIQGVLSGLGKENETIKSVRFMGDKAYIVTFRQTDPFYTIDVSDATNPQKVGELEVSGYSDYLQPIGEDKILGIGREADSSGMLKGLKIELFDVSDFENPSSLDSIVFADNTSTSLSYDHKAFAYRSSDALFAFPYQNYGDYSNNYETSSYLGVYQVKDDKLIDYQNIVNNTYIWGDQRGLIFDMDGTTYISFFANDGIITETLKEK